MEVGAGGLSMEEAGPGRGGARGWNLELGPGQASRESGQEKGVLRA